jgi:antitoxin component YwqK of YwqJK toxin-antitoxin module
MKMKKYILFTLLISSQFIILSCNKTIDMDKETGNFTQVDGRLVYKGERFTGTGVGTANLEKIKIEFKDGLKEGLWEVYHKNGNLKEKKTVLNGKLIGIYEIYNEDGKLSKRYKYDKEGKPILSEDFYKSGAKKIIIKFNDTGSYGESGVDETIIYDEKGSIIYKKVKSQIIISVGEDKIPADFKDR